MQKSILITGSSTGIGRDACETFAARDWTVFAGCRKPEDAVALTELGLTGVHLDYEDPASIDRAVDLVLAETGGRLEALFNNGAYAIPGPLEDLSRDAMTNASSGFLHCAIATGPRASQLRHRWMR